MLPVNQPNSSRKYSEEEKLQLIANLDIEVAHRTRQFEAWLIDRLENFTIHQEGQVSRIPKQVRGMTMREFGEKYQGNVQLALRGFQREKIVAAGGDSSLAEIDKSMRKRKRVAQEAEGDAMASPARASKSARTAPLSPKKVAGSSTGPGTAQRARLLATANKTSTQPRTTSRRAASPSPQKAKLPFGYNPTRPASPVKNLMSKPPASTHQRVPSSSSFNPALPPRTPAFPTNNGEPPTMRLPRRDESMLSVNGSPLANPYEFGMGWFKGLEMGEGDDDPSNHDAQTAQPGTLRTAKRAKSSIIIRRDPSVAFPASLNGFHSRTTSQASIFTSSSQTSSSTHSRENSQSMLSFAPTPSAFRFPSSRPADTYVEETPKPMSKHVRSFSAMVAIPTKDGHLLEFDPLQTSPGTLDALEGISDSAKKQARVEMGHLVQAAVDKWKIK